MSAGLVGVMDAEHFAVLQRLSARGTDPILRTGQLTALHRQHGMLASLAGLPIRCEIHNADLPKDLRPAVLFDAYYLCDVVADACQVRGWHYIGVGKSNCSLLVDGRNWPGSGLAGPDAVRSRRTAEIAQGIVAVGPNETAHQDVLTGRISSERVSIRYTHWRKRGSNCGPGLMADLWSGRTFGGFQGAGARLAECSERTGG